MPAYHDCKFSVSGAQAYFSNLNPIAEKIARDVNDTKSTYGGLWHTLTPSEQDEIINETLIKPEITIKYYESVTPSSTTTSDSSGAAHNDSNTKRSVKVDMKPTQPSQETQVSKDFCLQRYVYDIRNLRNFNQLTIASKLVQDDNFGVYRDEHSAPFSYRTRSQINLTLFEQSTPNNKTEKRLNCIKVGLAVNQPTLRPLNNILKEATQNNAEIIEDLKSSTNTDEHIKFNVKSDEQKLISFKPPTKIKSPNCIRTDAVAAALDFDEDKVNLKYYFGSRKKLTDSNSSVASTDEDEQLEDKRLCTEKVKLLESDNDIRRGFDFLNNW